MGKVEMFHVELAKGSYHQSVIGEDGKSSIVIRKVGDKFDVTKKQMLKIKPKLKSDIVVTSKEGSISKEDHEKALKDATKNTVSKADYDEMINDHKKQIVKLSENMVSKKDHDAIVEQLAEFKENSISKLDHDDLVKEAVDEAVEGMYTKKDLEAAAKGAKK